MALSGQSVDTLMQLLEGKLSAVEIFDREDAKEVKILERCREELQALTARRGKVRSRSDRKQGARSGPGGGAD